MFNKKMILTLVLLTALVAGMAHAGDYKIYGKLHTSVNMVNDSEDSQIGLSSNTSRFGVKGAQELNENFTFIWQFEQKLNIAQKGSETLANRNSFVGMKGDWGQVRFGIHDTPFKTLGRKTTFFKDTVGDNRAVTMGWDRRLSDIAAYVSPNFDGFSFFAAYHMDQAPLGAEEAASAYSANAMYNKDGILIGAAIETLSKGFSSDGEGGYGESQMGMRFAGKYTAEKFAVAAMFQSLSDVGGVADMSATTMGGEAMFQFDPMFAFKLAYFMADPNTDADDDEYNLLAIGVDHTYAKNITFYIQYAMMMNGDAQGMGIGGNGWGSSVPYGGMEGGESPTGISVGTYFTF